MSERRALIGMACVGLLAATVAAIYYIGPIVGPATVLVCFLLLLLGAYHARKAEESRRRLIDRLDNADPERLEEVGFKWR